MQFVRFYENTYKANVWVFLNCSEQDFCDLLNKYTHVNTQVEGDCAGRYVCLGSKGFDIHAIWMYKFDFTPEAYKHLVHELVHMTFSIFDNRGCPLTFKSSETAAYYMEMLIDLITKQLNEIKDKEKRKRNAKNNKTKRSTGTKRIDETRKQKETGTD